MDEIHVQVAPLKEEDALTVFMMCSDKTLMAWLSQAWKWRRA